jgi:hypothetical protein
MIGVEDGDARVFGYVIEPRGRLSWRPLSFQTDRIPAAARPNVAHYNLYSVHESLRQIYRDLYVNAREIKSGSRATVSRIAVDGSVRDEIGAL